MDAPPHETRRLALPVRYTHPGAGWFLSRISFFVFCFATLLENYGTIVVDVYCFYCTTEKENSSLSPENRVEKKIGEKRRFWYSQQIAKKELLTFINVGIY
jgi:hypothetical protein